MGILLDRIFSLSSACSGYARNYMVSILDQRIIRLALANLAALVAALRVAIVTKTPIYFMYRRYRDSQDFHLLATRIAENIQTGKLEYFQRRLKKIAENIQTGKLEYFQRCLKKLIPSVVSEERKSDKDIIEARAFQAMKKLPLSVLKMANNRGVDHVMALIQYGAKNPQMETETSQAYVDRLIRNYNVALDLLNEKKTGFKIKCDDQLWLGKTWNKKVTAMDVFIRQLYLALRIVQKIEQAKLEENQKYLPIESMPDKNQVHKSNHCILLFEKLVFKPSGKKGKKGRSVLPSAKICRDTNGQIVRLITFNQVGQGYHRGCQIGPKGCQGVICYPLSNQITEQGKKRAWQSEEEILQQIKGKGESHQTYYTIECMDDKLYHRLWYVFPDHS